MSQRGLERAVSLATGESMATVRRLGFLLAESLGASDDDLDAEAIDWDTLQSQRSVAAACSAVGASNSAWGAAVSS